MKRFLLFCLTALLSVATWAYDFEEGGLYYNITSESTVSVTYTGSQKSSTTYDGAIVIPSEVTHGTDTYTVTGIDDYCFYYGGYEDSNPGNNLNSITIPSTVTSIGEGAFYRCAKVTELVIPEGVTSFPYRMCYCCTTLEEINFPSTLTSIGDEAFRQCQALVNVEIPGNVTSIGSSAFYDCEYLETCVLHEGITSIGGSAFYDCYSLKEITIPEGITTVEASTFRYCRMLETAVISNTVTTLNSLAFGDCYSSSYPDYGMKYLTIGRRVKTMNDGCFARNQNLITITSLNSTPPEFGTGNSEPFYSITKGNITVYVPTQSIEAYQASSTWSGFNIVGLGYTLDAVTGDATDVENTSATLNGSVNLGDDGVVYERGFEYYTSSNDIHTVVIDGTSGDMTTTLTGLTPNTTYYYYAYATNDDGKTYGVEKSFRTKAYDFYVDNVYYAYGEVDGTCEVIYELYQSSTYNTEESYVGEIVVPAQVSYEGNTYTVVGVKEYAFSGCPELKSVTLADGITTIGQYAFYNCEGLESVTLPSDLTSLGQYAFYNCSSLESVNLSDDLTAIETYTFYGCSSLTYVRIPDNVTELAQYSFAESGLQEVTIGRSVTSIATYTFNNDASLTKVSSLNPEPPTCLTETGGSIFSRQTYTPFEGVTIAKCALYVPSGSEEDYAAADTWKEFGSIYTIGVPLTETEVATCITKETVILNGTVLEDEEPIIDKGFEYWTNEDDVVRVAVDEAGERGEITAYITGLAKDATYTYRVYGTTQYDTYYGEELSFSTAERNADFYVDGLFYIYGTDDATCVVTFEDADYNTYSGVVDVPETTTYVGTEYTVVGIGDSAFRECSDLTEVTLPETITTIDIWAFYNCVGLTEVVIPDNVTEVGNQAFNGCTSIKSLIIGSGVETIGNNSFNCSALAEITSLNPTPPTCDQNAFREVDTETCVLYIPIGSYEEYSTADVWEDFYMKEMVEFNVETLEATDVTDVSAVFNGIVVETYNEPGSIARKGFEYWANESTNIVTAITIDGDDITFTVSTLNPETTYTYRVFVQMSDGTYVYANEVSFTTKEAVATGINGISVGETDSNEYYTIEGKKLSAPLKGVNIVRNADGTTKKVLVK